MEDGKDSRSVLGVVEASAVGDARLPGEGYDIVPFEEEERRIILRALELTRWNVQEAAARLGIGRATIYRKIERYGLRTVN